MCTHLSLARLFWWMAFYNGFFWVKLSWATDSESSKLTDRSLLHRYISSFGVYQTYYELNQLSDQSVSFIYIEVPILPI